MLFLSFILSLLITSPAWTNSNHERLSSLSNVKRIAFGSCNNQNDEQPLWKDMMTQKPDLFIWGGDNVYADWQKSESVFKAYEKQNKNPDYALFKSQTPMIGTWDDHDFAGDGSGGNLSFKKISQKLHLDFFDEPEDSPRRLQEGIYKSFDFKSDGEKIKIIILDNRYFKGLDPNAPLLGEDQWLWLEEELKNSSASLHFFVTGLSIFSPLIPYTEEWWHYPQEVQRLQNLLKLYQVKAPVFLTGDKHFSAIFKYYGQLEFISSGLTHTAPRSTWWYLGRRYTRTYFGLSYGIIDIEWDKGTPILTLFMRNGKKDIHRQRVVWQGGTWHFR